MARMRARLSSGLALALFAMPPAAAPLRGQEIGYVAEVVGAWTLRTPEGAAVPVVRVLAVPPRGVLLPPRPHRDGDRVRVVIRGGEVWQSVCREGRCARVELPARPRIRTPLQRLADGAGRLFARDPQRFASLFSRGPGAGWREGVALLDGDGVALDSVLAGAPAGVYALLFRPFDDPGGPAAALVEAPWDPAAPRPARVSGLRPGLYLVEGYAPGVEGGAGAACVLVRGVEGFAADRNRFAQARRLVRGWPPGGSPNAAREFLCATLDLLARGGGDA